MNGINAVMEGLIDPKYAHILNRMRAVAFNKLALYAFIIYYQLSLFNGCNGKWLQEIISCLPFFPAIKKLTYYQ
jgi:hypothetical protein